LGTAIAVLRSGIGIPPGSKDKHTTIQVQRNGRDHQSRPPNNRLERPGETPAAQPARSP
jgi:hypothetical protein